MKKLIYFTAPLWLYTVSFASEVTLTGNLQEKGSKTPLADVSIYILPVADPNVKSSAPLAKGKSGADGKFAIAGVPEGAFRWVINHPSYRRLEEADEQSASAAPSERTLYLEKSNYQVFETTVFGKGDKRDDTRRSLKVSQIQQIAGAGNDPIKAVQNLPGVNRPSGFQSQVIIQGSAPRDTVYQIDGQDVPIVFHFGGLTSIVQPEALDRVDYLSAGYGPENGRALGGVIGLWTRSPRTDRVHGLGFVDVFNAGALVEGAVSADKKSSFLLGVRQSYIGAVLKAVIKPDSQFNLTVAPSFGDVIGIYETELTPIDQLKVLAVGSRDSLEFLLSQPVDADPSFRGNFNLSTSFFRLVPQLTHKHSAITTSRWSLGLGRDWQLVDAGDSYFYLHTYSMTARGEVERKWNEEWTSQFGFDNRYVWANVDTLISIPYSAGGISSPFSGGQKRQANVDATTVLVGAYWRNEWKPTDSKWTLLPSVRTEYHKQNSQTFVLPRAAARYTVDDSLYLRAGGGLYAQPPQEQELSDIFGNPELNSPRAWHASIGAEKDLRGGSSRGWIVSGGGFYKYFDQLVLASTALITRNGTLQPENYNNSGRGRAFGGELLLKFEGVPSPDWSGWISYTVSRSTRWTDSRPEYLFTYDQTHLLTAIGSYELGRNWRIGARVRYVTGNPYTPITGATFDADNDVFSPTRGVFYSERLDPFFQTDLRLDKKWINNTWIFSAYLDVQNVTNRKNIEQIRYAYDYSTKSSVSGLPVIPVFGLKGEF